MRNRKPQRGHDVTTVSRNAMVTLSCMPAYDGRTTSTCAQAAAPARSYVRTTTRSPKPGVVSATYPKGRGLGGVSEHVHLRVRPVREQRMHTRRCHNARGGHNVRRVAGVHGDIRGATCHTHTAPQVSAQPRIGCTKWWIHAHGWSRKLHCNQLRSACGGITTCPTVCNAGCVPLRVSVRPGLYSAAAPPRTATEEDASVKTSLAVHGSPTMATVSFLCGFRSNNVAQSPFLTAPHTQPPTQSAACDEWLHFSSPSYTQTLATNAQWSQRPL